MLSETHGSGVFTTNIESAWDVTSTEDIESEKPQLIVYPNPTHGNTNLTFYSKDAAQVEIKIVDSKGNIARSYLNNISKGVNNLEVDLSSLNSGHYIISIASENNNITNSIVIR